MKTITIITPSNIEIEYKLAGVGSRLAAFIIDTILQLLATLLCAGILLGINHQLSDIVRISTLLAIFLVLSFVIHFGYFIVCELTMNGQTVGKMLFGLRVIRDNGQPIEFTQALIRGIIRSTLDAMYVGLFVILFSKKHKRIGDMAAGTIVIIEKYDNKYEAAQSMQDHNIPDFIPPLENMTPQERAVIENWLRRRHKLPNYGMEIGVKIAEYFRLQTICK